MTHLNYKRSHRVSQAIQKELGLILVNGIKDPRIGFTTVTEVRLSDDLRYAKIFVSIYGSEKVRKDTLQGLHNARGFLKKELGKSISLRYMPNFTFYQDTTLDHVERLDKLINSNSNSQISDKIDHY